MRIVLGVSGGIAAYKAAEIARALIQNGHEVQAVLTRAAEEFIRPLTFASLTGRKVITDIFSSASPEATLSSSIEHIGVAQETRSAARRARHGQRSREVCARSRRRFPLDSVSRFSRPCGARARDEYQYVGAPRGPRQRRDAAQARAYDRRSRRRISRLRHLWPGPLGRDGQDRRSGRTGVAASA